MFPANLAVNGNGHNADPMDAYIEAQKAAAPNLPKRDRSMQGQFNPPYPDIAPYGGGADLFSMLLPFVQTAADQAPAWSYYPAFRDKWLRNFYKSEPVMAGTVYSMSAKVSSMSYHLEGRNASGKKRLHDMFGYCNDGTGLSEVFRLTAECLLTQDNGAFWELRGGGNPNGELRGPVTNIYFIDPAQCWRTIDPEYPVYYINPYTGRVHRLHRTRVVRFAQMAQPDELGRHVGFCAVSRALQASQIMRAINTYKHEKITGNFKRAIGFINGVNAKGLQGGLNADADLEESTNLTMIGGVPFLSSFRGNLSGSILDLASIPDGFNAREDIETYVYIMALCFGVDVREIWAATAAGATKADATIQHLKAQGKGIGDIIQTLERAVNWHIIGRKAGVELKLDYVDVEEQRIKAEIDEKKVGIYSTMLNGGAITSEQFAALCIADQIVDPNVLATAQPQPSYDDQAPNTDENMPEDGKVDDSEIEANNDQADDQSPDDNPPPPNKRPNRAANGQQNGGGSKDASSDGKAARNADFEPITDDDIDAASRELDKLLKRSA